MNRSRLLLVVFAVSLGIGQARSQEQAGGGSAVQAAPANDRFAAIAYSSATQRYGYSYNCRSLERAKELALSNCGTSDARVVGWSKNGYIAIARGYRGATGWGWASDADTARRNALDNCLRYSSYANVVVWVSAKQ